MINNNSLKNDFEIKDWISWTKSQQLLASDPTRSAWVSANAGSGKTHILVLRVLRLLLANTNPSSILCLTHTQAAAAEMSNRVFEIITEWSHLSDEKLYVEITKIQDKKPTRIDISRARNLIIKILETPGGLKAQTIHSFCESIIQQFPLEANITGQFSILDKDQSKKMIEEAKKSTLASIVVENNVELKQSLAEILELVKETDLEQLISNIISHRYSLNKFSSFANNNGGEEIVLKNRFELSHDESDERIRNDLWPLQNFEQEYINKYVTLYKENGKGTKLKQAKILEDILIEESFEKRFSLLSEFFLNKDLSPRSQIITTIANKSPDLKDKIKKAQQTFIQIQERFNKYKMFKMTMALLILAKHLNTHYEELKKKHCFLDFEDLIVYTNDLLKKRDVSAWIRYKLDQEINHILIDEVQDTSMIQWEVIRSLTEDFFVGENAHSHPRTLFAVGDEKQSIFSFQGAKPNLFFREKQINQQRITNAGQKFSAIQLPLSFRSTADILTAVDKVFSIPENAQGLSEDKTPILHRSNRIGHAGNVQLWDQVLAKKNPRQEDWISYFDSSPQESSASILARRIANTISDMIGSDTIISNGKKRFVRADDILVLVRKRSPFIALLARFLKNDHKISVSSNDRFILSKHLAIKDLMSLGYFVLSQEDDLSLAALLKSPLFNLSEDDLFEICAKRQQTETVYDSIKKISNDKTSKFHHITEYIHELINLSKSHSAYDFFTLILGAKNGRKQFIARFGTEVVDVIDEFLDFALRNEQKSYFTLQEFISELEYYPPEIKSNQSRNHHEVRIMTVHGAKGLESPVVFLVDYGTEILSNNHINNMHILPSSNDEPGTPIWIPTKKLRNSIISSHIEYLKKAAMEEYHRLLYVGMTRASDKLIICSYINQENKTNKRTWHDMVEKSFNGDKRAKKITPKTSANKDEWSAWQWNIPCNEDTIIAEESIATQLNYGEKLPKEFFSHIQNDTITPYILNPSMLDKKDEPTLNFPLSDNNNDDDALKRGLIIHKLLEIVFKLPLEQRKQSIVSYLKKNSKFWTIQEYENLVSSITSLLEHPIVSTAMSCLSYTEVSISGKINFPKQEVLVSGRVDQISIDNENVFIFEYKTNRNIPQGIEDIPISHIIQLSIYRELLKDSYTDKSFVCLLIYVLEPKVFIIPQCKLDEALLKISKGNLSLIEK
ncbi:MAG: double-strand break repair helicase AddA [Candidatus Liberibacter europaeus]|uniref:DNA 3'-5' helicase n=1 Tax=Candidatus Liberibacter europaeus TaxID=744859 RepID=A0A2T4VZ84_9HYPH|nr:MAG: double-strand break repair helicase AddA [Candidatus Liberibacter europaeus]